MEIQTAQHQDGRPIAYASVVAVHSSEDGL